MYPHRENNQADNSVLIKDIFSTVVGDLNDGLNKVHKMVRALVQCGTVCIVSLEIEE